MNDRGYFYISGLIASFFYILIFLIFLLYIKPYNVKKINTSIKTTVLELELVVDVVKKNEDIVAKQIKEKSKNSAEEVTKKSTSKSLDKTANIQSLFAKVTTKTKDVRKDIINNIEKNLVSSRFKSKFEKESKNDNVEISKILENVKKSNPKLQLSNSSEENDPYYSKIYDILSSGWNPKIIIDELYARIIVTIYSDGKFDYRFLQYSNNEQFDSDLEEFLNSQKMISFPPHNKGIKTDIDIIFKSKE